MQTEKKAGALFKRHQLLINLFTAIFFSNTAETDIVVVYKDKGFSGKNTDRLAFKKLVNDVKTGIIEKVIVYRLDRFTRSLADFSINYNILKDNNCAFISRAEKFDTSTSAGRAMLSIVAVFAELERETIPQRVKDNYYKIMNDTRQWLGGTAPYGFEALSKRLEQKDNIELWNGEKVAYIVNTGKSDKRTKEALEKSIIYLLDMQGFITSDMFLSIQKRMENNKQIGGGNKSTSAWGFISGLVKCGKCGYAIKVFNPKYSYIGCSGRIILKECNASFKNGIVNIKSIQEKTGLEIQKHIRDIETSTQKKKAEYQKTQKEIDELENKIEELVKLAGLVEVEQIAKQIKENKDKINKLRLQADFYIEPSIRYNDIDFFTLSDEEKQKITQELINKILVFEDGNIKIEWKL